MSSFIRHHRHRQRQTLIALLQLLQSLLNRHCAASVFESADSIQKAPVASKRMAGTVVCRYRAGLFVVVIVR